MVCLLFGAKPLPEPVLTSCQLEWKKLEWKNDYFRWKNAPENVLCNFGGYIGSDSAHSMCWQNICFSNIYELIPSPAVTKKRHTPHVFLWLTLPSICSRGHILMESIIHCPLITRISLSVKSDHNIAWIFKMSGNIEISTHVYTCELNITKMTKIIYIEACDKFGTKPLSKSMKTHDQ